MGDRTDRRSVLGTRNDSEQENRAMTETTITATRTIRNGVDTATMFAPLDAIKGPARDRLPGPQPVARWRA
jgi:hypothetical protein